MKKYLLLAVLLMFPFISTAYARITSPGQGVTMGEPGNYTVTPTGGTAGTLADALGKQGEFNLAPYLTYGTVNLFDITASGTDLSSPTARFTVADEGKPIVVYNTGTSYFRGTIDTVTDANNIVLSASATAGCSGSCSAAYGVNEKTGLDSGLAAAAALRPTIANPYFKIKAVIPFDTFGKSVGLSTNVDIPDGVELSSTVPITNLAPSVNTYVLTAGVSGIGDLRDFNAAGGSGIDLNASGPLRNFHIGNLGVWNVGFSGPWGLKCSGNGYSIYVDGNISVSSGSYSYDFSSCDDVHIGGIAVATGGNRGMIMNGTQDAQIDYSADTIGTYAFKGDALRNVRARINSFANNTNSDWTAGILLGATSTTVSTGVMIDYLAEKAQGAAVPMVSMDYTSGSWLKILEAPGGSGTDFATLLAYGANNTGTNYIEAVTNSALTLYTGTPDAHVHITNVVGGTKSEYGGMAYPKASVTPTSGIYRTSFPGGSAYTIASTKNRAWAIPEIFLDATPVAGLGFRTSTAGSGSSCTAALYDSGGTGNCPGNLVAQTSTIATDSANTDYYLAYTQAPIPTPGILYWKVIKCDWSTTAPFLAAASEARVGVNAIMGSSSLGGASGRDASGAGYGFYAASVAAYPTWDAAFGSCTRSETVSGAMLTPKF